MTLAIPTYNGAARLPALLAALAVQETDDSAASFEVLVVDNASTDDTTRVAREHPAVAELAARGVSCRVVHESRPGLTYARVRAVLEAQAPVVCFLDDDTVPAENYVRDGVRAFADSRIGLVVSRVFPDFESPPPPAVARREHLLAINHRLGDSPIVWGPGEGFTPSLGAGLWVRKDAFLKAVPYAQPEDLLPDRIGGALVSGGDIEIGYLIGRAGYLRSYRPELRLMHQLPASRLRIGYFCRLIVGVVRSGATLDRRYGAFSAESAWHRRVLAALRLGILVLTAPVTALLHRDGVREVLFAAAAAWGRVRGPYDVARTRARPGVPLDEARPKAPSVDVS